MGGKKKEYQNLPCPAFNSNSAPQEKPLTVLGSAVAAFLSCPQISSIVITVPPGGESAAKACLAGNDERLFFVKGGPTRRASVHNALLFLKQHNPSYVLIHDGARPWIKQDLIKAIINAVIRHNAVIPVLPLLETPKEICSAEKTNGAEIQFIKQHLRRGNLCCAQTPQGFKFPEILRAHEKAAEKESLENFEYTDDAEVWGEFIGRVAVISGDPENRKITYPEDIK